MSSTFRIIFLLLGMLYHINVFSNSRVYPNEQLLSFANAQTLTYFSKGRPDKPLIVFVPGDSHLARISYGSPQGLKKDFLAYWIKQKGYSFLGASYPLANPVFTQKYPEFTIQQWAQQLVKSAQFYIKKNQLGNHIVVLGWSMGGAVEQVVYAAAQKEGLEMDLFIGLAAVPPLPYIMQHGSFDTGTMGTDYLAKRSQIVPWFTQQLRAQNALNEHEIIPQDLYISDYIGDIPIAIAAEGYYFKDKRFITDKEQVYRDSGVFNFAQTPWIALIVDDSVSDSKISLIDPYSWDFIRAEMMYHRYLKQPLTMNAWLALRKIIKKLPEQLTATVHGNHFFFVGEQGARDTANQIELLIDRVREIQSTVQNQLALANEYASLTEPAFA